ncbi:sn-glycerol-3-phosphate ABC transporter ATP-binding protein UgpC [Reinekea marinisedimentorum]|uniref:sn-glycerol 3-phosphate transport system ATP-binding protein n=1 Tax=Reinekea marinisedimentorum TaxID=230495 RepID=A0A4R3HZR5_9GAMM|nr:sn-glycerol-3-phosphate ABC transporter ATP-binding protein UgpC [Reinekea marinisedimentorum]TCS38748.1 sn-glycerol 3-phosphate transport system ATP-binding protein [Reinekea marinisedimentorum]
MGALKLSSIEKTYPNGHRAVRGVSLEIEPGEFLVLVGPSGCGKSTILRTIAGLEQLTGGEIHIAEERVDERLPAKRDIAMVFQNYALYPHMSVYKNMAYGLKNRGVSKEEINSKVTEAAKMLQLTDYLERKPSQLSGGQRQRVAMGRAMVRSPKLFLFDEPLSNLDARLRAEMRLEIKQLQRKLKTTSVFVTHDQVEAMTLADRLVVLNQGEIQQVGTPKEVYHQPANIFVATFLGAPAMNLFEARVTSANEMTLNDGQTIQLPAEMANRVEPGRNVTVGIRPEHLALTQNGQRPLLNFETGLSEELGTSQLLHGKIAGTDCTLNLPHFDQHSEDQLGVVFEPKHLHLFDVETGKRIDHG